MLTMRWSCPPQAYINVAPAVAAFDEYFEPLAWHLLRAKLRHWEKALRELAAQALAALVPCCPAFFLNSALPFMLPLCTDPVLEARHGAVAGVAELLPALHCADPALPPDLQACVAGVLPAIEAARLTRGKGGEVMRSAICRLIETSAASGLPLDPLQQACAWRQVCENLRHASPDIQAAAAAALAAFALHYLPGWAPEEQQREALARFLSDLADRANPPARRGAALALGALPAWLLVPAAGSVLAALASAATLETEPEARDAETRVNAVRSLTQVVLKLHSVSASSSRIDGSSSTIGGYKVVLGVLPHLIAALDDYSTDNRGDVGSWVREAAMEGLVSLLLAVLPPCPDPTNAARLQPLVQAAATALIKQAVERIAHVREVATRQLARLLPAASTAGAAPAAADALTAAAAAHPEDDPGSLEALPAAAALLRWQEYRQPLLEGLAFSIGGLDRQLSEAAADALAAAGQDLSADEAASLAASLLDAWTDHTRAGRLCTPLLLTAEVLLARTPVGGVQSLPEATEAGAASTISVGRAERGSNSFPARLLAAVRNTLRGCTDIPRLHAGVGVFCQLASSAGGDGVSREALCAVLLLLANRYPKVRRYTAEAVYTLLLTLEFEEEAWAAGEEAGDAAAAGAGEPPDTDAAMELLLETAWDGPLEAARTARARVFELLRLPSPVAFARAGGGVGEVVAAARPTATPGADENASYAALIERVARGL